MPSTTNKYDLSDTPIRIRARRGWGLAMLGLGAALTALDAWLLLHDPTTPFRLKLEMLPAPLLLVLGLLQLASRPLLEITPDGLSHSDALLRRVYRWREIGDPRVQGLVRHVVFDYRPEGGRLGLLPRLMAWHAGASGNLGGGWEIEARELAALLQAAKARWG